MMSLNRGLNERKEPDRLFITRITAEKGGVARAKGVEEKEKVYYRVQEPTAIG